jgi:hypothetical protein
VLDEVETVMIIDQNQWTSKICIFAGRVVLDAVVGIARIENAISVGGAWIANVQRRRRRGLRGQEKKRVDEFEESRVEG